MMINPGYHRQLQDDQLTIALERTGLVFKQVVTVGFD